MAELKNMKCGEQVPALRNLKFRVSSPEQSKALQEVLQCSGYKETKSWCYGETPQWIYASFDGGMYLELDDFYKTHADVPYVEQDTAAFIHEANNTKRAESLEEAYDNQSSENIFAAARAADEFVGVSELDAFVCTWLENHGEMPVEGDVYVDVEYRSGFLEYNKQTIALDWEVSGNHAYDIVKWRYSRAEDYFKQPKTPTHDLDNGWCRTIEESEAANKVLMAEQEEAAEEIAQIDSHYDFTYYLTPQDEIAGFIKIDPYFVAKQWELGSKDDSGVVWHIFKTCARFGEKNDKAREITAIYKSIKRLAELEGVVLK